MSEQLCPASGKICYPSHAAAKAARGRRMNKGTRMRAYRCPSCSAWHLTTMPQPNRRRERKPVPVPEIEADW